MKLTTMRIIANQKVKIGMMIVIVMIIAMTITNKPNIYLEPDLPFTRRVKVASIGTREQEPDRA